MQNNTYNEFFARGQFYDMVDGKKTLCQVKEKVVTLTAATANQTVVPAVTGKSIVVLEGNIYSQGVAASIAFLDGSGGTVIKRYYVPANTLAEPNVQMPPARWGLLRTSSGVGLFASTAGGAAVELSISYIEVVA